jgi:hypothetical protein
VWLLWLPLRRELALPQPPLPLRMLLQPILSVPATR